MQNSKPKSIRDSALYKKLVDYRDVIILLLFFVGGGAWIYNTFVTNCLMDASLESQKISSIRQDSLNKLSDKRIEIRILESLEVAGVLNNEQKHELDNLRKEYREMAEVKWDDADKVDKAYARCRVF